MKLDKSTIKSAVGVGKKMKKVLLVLVLMILVALVCEYHGYRRGFTDGEKITNSWWIDKKSTYYDISEVVKKRYHKKLDEI